MTLRVKLILAVIVAAILAVLVLNLRYLFVAPVANTWTWWPGDETWLLSEYKHFFLTGHYVNPTAPGSAFAESSGLIFGSCYITAFLYAFPLLLFPGHSIDVGRIVTAFIAIGTLIALWRIAKQYNIPTLLRAAGLLLLASTVCFFATSHSARPDMVVGLSMLLLAGILPIAVEKNSKGRDLLFGLLLPGSLLINGHVLIIGAPMMLYAIWQAGVFRSTRRLAVVVAIAAMGFLLLLGIQYVLLGSLNILGPFTDQNSTMPFARLFHPRAHYTNYFWRYFIAKAWAPAILYIAVVFIAALAWAKFRLNVAFSELPIRERRFLVCVALAVLSSVYIEYYWPRYFIYVLPTIVLSFLVLLSFLIQRFPRTHARVLQVVLVVCIAEGLWQYGNTVLRMGTVGETISEQNESALRDALRLIHERYARMPHVGSPRIFAAVPGQNAVMDDSAQLLTPVLYDWRTDRSLSRADVWKRSHIDFAIVYFPYENGNRSIADSNAEWVARSGGQLILERPGAFTDMDRPYDPANLANLDTLRVYEYHK
ncbi:MAG TPA: glycosyltransferase family 39 protein [Candidatus Kapabacteria bacterium]|jgi:hypothetical protein